MAEERDYLVWSHEHAAWWTPGRGYAARLSEAGHFTRAEALRICGNAMPGTADRIGALPELPVRLADVLELRDAHRLRSPASDSWE